MQRLLLLVGLFGLQATSWAADVDEDSYDHTVDCNDDNPMIHPGADEVCEGGNPLSQIDNDCDGSVNTQGGAYFIDPTQLGVDARGFYFDADTDTYGEAGEEQYFLCSRAAEPQASFFVTNDSDCDDADPAVNPSAVELCNDRDDNCNDVVDEPTSAGGDLPPGCTPFYPDEDQDGSATSDPEAASLCVCNGFAGDPANTPNECNPGVDPAVNVWWAGDCWSADNTDCADTNVYVHAPTGGAPGVDRVDGIDSDCDGLLGLLELDCDDDGSFAGASGVDPTDVLGSCAIQGTAPSLACFGFDLPVLCDHVSGEWGVSVDLLNSIGVMSGPFRFVTGGSCDGVDCDDLCPNRCEGRYEACDGVDNDCSVGDVPIDGNQDGLPDALDSARSPEGTVDVSETSVSDGGWLYECGGEDGGEEVAPVSTCEPLDTVERPSQDTDEASCGTGSCGCASSPSSPLFAAFAALGLVVRRRRV